MDSTSIDAVASSAGRRIELSLLLDSGQVYTCLPAQAWQALSLSPRRSMPMARFDGSSRVVDVGECVVELPGLGVVTTPVVLGGPGDLALLGTLTLAELGLVLDPLTRTIQPAEMRLGIAVAAG